MSTAVQAIDDLFATAAVDALAADLTAAIGEGKEWARLSNGETFVVAYRDLGQQVVGVVGNTGGWWAVRTATDGPPTVSQPFLTAGEAVRSLPVVEP